MRRQREARRAGVQLGKRPYLAHRAARCERCGHVPLLDRVLSVHHVNGDHHDNRPENLRTLCLNCHAEVHGLLVAQADNHEAAAA
jgi:5-methylcytosine-specific restriction endonuclease McrA